jgi:cytochrome P450
VQRFSAGALSDLIGLIYEGPLEPTPWANSLRQLNRTLDFSWTILVLRPASRSLPSLIIQAHEQEVTVSNADYIFFDRYSSDPFTDLPLNRITTPEDLLGVHRCLGSHLAKLEVGTSLQEWLPRIPEFQLGSTDHIEIFAGPVMGLRSLPLQWTTAA